MFTEPEANYCCSIILRREYQELQNDRHKSTDVIVRVHVRMQP